jgi:hypothetical protein
VFTSKSLSLDECAQKCRADAACTCFDFTHAKERKGRGPDSSEKECRQMHGALALVASSKGGKDAYTPTFAGRIKAAAPAP